MKTVARFITVNVYDQKRREFRSGSINQSLLSPIHLYSSSNAVIKVSYLSAEYFGSNFPRVFPKLLLVGCKYGFRGRESNLSEFSKLERVCTSTSSFLFELEGIQETIKPVCVYTSIVILMIVLGGHVNGPRNMV